MSNTYGFGNVARLLPPEPKPLPSAVEIDIEASGDATSEIDPKTGTLTIRHPDGSVEIDTNPQQDNPCDDSDHFANLAENMDQADLNRIASDLLRAIEMDDQGRRDWLDTTEEGIGLLGLELKKPGTSAGGQLEGTSKVVHPLLLEAVLRFQANARGELLPSDGPVKVRNDGEESANTADLAQALEDDLNHYLTVVATEYVPDTDRMLLFVGFRGCGFKKVYRCPIRRRPVSESVNAKDMIVSNTATDLKSCGRVTHAVTMRPSTLRRMQLLGAYRDVPLTDVVPKSENPVDRKIAEVQGTQTQTQISLEPADRDRDLYETYAELDLDQFAPKAFKGEGIPLPYKVTIDRDSREILQLSRNWKPDDEQCLPKTMFVKYPFVPGFGFYDIGLLQILGNTALAATAGWRELLDAGMFANFPGFLYLKALGKQLTNEFRVPPGGGLPIDSSGDDIRKAIMPLPYKEPGAATMQLIENIVQQGQRVGGTAELPVGEGTQNAPVGTTLALIEQSTKIESAVHKRLHQAQGEELKLLLELFMEDPEALWRHNKKSACLKLMMVENGQGAEVAAQEAAQEAMHRKFVAALANVELVPQADPNTSSQMARIMKAVAVKQLQAQNPQLYDAKEVDTRILRTIGWDDVDSLFVPPAPQAPPQSDPAMMLMAQAKMKDSDARVADNSRKLQETQIKAATAVTTAQQRQEEIKSKERIAALQVAEALAIHPTSQQVAMGAARDLGPGNPRNNRRP